MTMTRANIVTLATSLSHDKADATTIQDSYDDVLDELARGVAPFVETETFTPTDGVAGYAYPTTAVVLLSIFHGGRQLRFTPSKELESYADDWRLAAEGSPYVFTFHEIDAREVRLFPTPSTTAVDGGTFLFGENRTTDIPEWLTLPIVFEMLAEEFAYPSDHQDMEMAEACNQMAQFLKMFTGLM